MNILKISRPRFWLYELGTYAIGVAAGFLFLQELDLLNILIFGFYFLFPANLLIYGINDIFDYETDKLNPKKNSYEELVDPEQHKKIYKQILLFNIPFIVYGLFVLNFETFIWLFLFLFFATFYSAKPIRAKTKPFLDSFFSAGHYIATGIFGYILIGGDSIPWTALIAGMLWAISMHAYSAIPDITSDLSSGIKTIATKFGIRNTIVLCTFFYISAFVLAGTYLGLWAYVLLTPYLAFMFISYKAETEEKIFKVYKYFPILNALVGMTVFFFAAL